MESKEANQNPNVLVVEDEPLISEAIAGHLVDRGFRVCVVPNANEALSYLASNPIDALFTDINLPGELDGAMLAQRARELSPELPVVYASGRATRDQFLSVSRSVFIPKPYDPDQVCTTLRRLVETP